MVVTYIYKLKYICLKVYSLNYLHDSSNSIFVNVGIFLQEAKF